MVLYTAAVIGMPIWDKVSPLEGCDKIIETHYGDQFAWCVGLSYSFHDRTKTEMRAYILIPSCFSNPSVAMVTKVENAMPEVTDSTVVLLVVLFVYGSLTRALWNSYQRSRASAQQSLGSGNDQT